MMQKNESGISFSQWRTVDLTVFAAITAIAEIAAHFAAVWFPDAAIYSFSLMLPLVTVVFMRWGWQGIPIAVADGALYCFLNGGDSEQYIAYVVGNGLISAELILIAALGKKKISNSAALSMSLLVIGYSAVNLSRSVVYALLGESFLGAVSFAFGFGDSGLLALVMGAVILFVLRRLDGMFEDQKAYMLRQEEERRRLNAPDGFGDNPYVEISDEDISILKKTDYDI